MNKIICERSQFLYFSSICTVLQLNALLFGAPECICKDIFKRWPWAVSLFTAIFSAMGLQRPSSSSSSPALLFLFLFLLQFLAKPAFCEVVFESGYAVTTVFDGNKVNIHPLYVLPRIQEDETLLLLDSAGSTFYTLSPAGKINLFSGNGTGFLDGDAAAAKFNHPRSFAVDSKGNVYVADKNNHAIRKISRSSVTTIAGGYANKGHTDGPAQNATFSNDFYLSFFPKICALIITDRGSNLVRLMHLKPEDCAHGSRVVSWPWVTLIGFICLLLGSVAGFVGRPFLTSLLQRQPQGDTEALLEQPRPRDSDGLLRHHKRNC